MRIRRRRRRSKIGERTSIVESIAYLPMLSYRAQTGTSRGAFLNLEWLETPAEFWFSCGTDTLVCAAARLALDVSSRKMSKGTDKSVCATFAPPATRVRG